MNETDLAGLVERLAAMPDVLDRHGEGRSSDDLRWQPAEDAFSLVEHACHLRDLEVEGYAVRIRRLLDEVMPSLEGFDGTRVARERDYRSQDFRAAASAFREARLANVRLVRGLRAGDLARPGTFESTDSITLGGVLEMMGEHDDDHVRQLEDLAARLAR